MNEELIKLMALYQQTFNEAPPMMVLPEDEQAAMDILRRVIETRDTSLFDQLIPADAAA